MVYRFNPKNGLIICLLCFLLSGCMTFRVIQVNDGHTISAPATELTPGKTTLTDVLIRYGSPDGIFEMHGKIMIVYERSHYRGGQVSFGIPMSDITGVNINVTTFGNLLRYDTLAFIFNNDYMLSDLSFVKGTDHPFWHTLWQDQEE